MKPSEHPNCRRWLRPPTIEQIEAVVKASGSSELQFERYYGIYTGCIKNIRLGVKKMPVQYWHIFLEDKESVVAKTVAKTVSATQKIPKKKRTKVDPNSKLANLI
ncbi:MAG: hypothetical protein KBA90_13285 [Chitinophagaceae bacterium]|nr:hypothetical protein [Chitinophagaceae bacterium]MBP7109524.1 hypothetical protein [Chitinophagaceae bacterium]